MCIFLQLLYKFADHKMDKADVENQSNIDGHQNHNTYNIITYFNISVLETTQKV